LLSPGNQDFAASRCPEKFPGIYLSPGDVDGLHAALVQAFNDSARVKGDKVVHMRVFHENYSCACWHICFAHL